MASLKKNNMVRQAHVLGTALLTFLPCLRYIPLPRYYLTMLSPFPTALGKNTQLIQAYSKSWEAQTFSQRNDTLIWLRHMKVWVFLVSLHSKINKAANSYTHLLHSSAGKSSSLSSCRDTWISSNLPWTPVVLQGEGKDLFNHPT